MWRYMKLQKNLNRSSYKTIFEGKEMFSTKKASRCFYISRHLNSCMKQKTTDIIFSTNYSLPADVLEVLLYNLDQTADLVLISFVDK